MDRKGSVEINNKQLDAEKGQQGVDLSKGKLNNYLIKKLSLHTSERIISHSVNN